MRLKFVTLTGADDTVDPADLLDISREFPFVEWGILIGSIDGTSRFPSWGFIEKLIALSYGTMIRPNLSLHICGRWLRGIMNGQETLLRSHPEVLRFQRCQLNFHAEDVGDAGENILLAFERMRPWDPQVIFQFDRVNERLILPTSRKFSVAALFDESHGAGIVPDSWRQSYVDFPCGYAGGLGPDNVAQELPRIQKASMDLPFWIDMETKLFSTVEGRTVFDLNKCVSVLESVNSYCQNENKHNVKSGG